MWPVDSRQELEFKDYLVGNPNGKEREPMFESNIYHKILFQELLSGVSPLQREILEMISYQMSAQEICDELSLDESNFFIELGRALKDVEKIFCSKSSPVVSTNPNPKIAVPLRNVN